MITAGKLEVNCKISKLPTFSTDRKGWYEFHVNCDGVVIRVRVKPKVWKKIADANQNWPIWVASITGKMGPRGKKVKQFCRDSIYLNLLYKCLRKSPSPRRKNQ